MSTTIKFDETTASPSPYTPPSVTLTSTPTLAIHSLNCLQVEYSHRAAAPCSYGQTDALIAAAVRGLSSLTEARTKKLLSKIPSASKSLRLNADGDPLLAVTIRTNNRDLIEAGEYLRSAPALPADDPGWSLQTQLLRFDVAWALLPKDSPELQALQRWAEITCKPGLAAERDEEAVRAYRAKGYDQQGYDEPEAEGDDTHSNHDQEAATGELDWPQASSYSEKGYGDSGCFSGTATD